MTEARIWHRGRRARRVIAVLVVLGTFCLGAGAAIAATEPAVNGLVYSTTSADGSVRALARATVNGTIFVRVNSGDGSIRAATYYLDDERGSGTPAYTATTAPYAMAPNGLDTSELSAGQHSVLAVLTLASGDTSDMFARFAVQATPQTPKVPLSQPPSTTQTTPTTEKPAAPDKPTAIPSNGKQVCEQYGSTRVAGDAYLVQNNNWGDATGQCISAFDTGFAVTSASHSRTDHPGAYPSIMSGCWMQTCTTGTKLPALVSALPAITTSAQTTAPSDGKYNIAYDIWADPTARKNGQNTGAELMIWLKQQGGINPIGTKTATANIGGATWDVWTGKNGATPVISWVRQTPVTSVSNLPIKDFVDDGVTRGIVKTNWYLTNIQFGFEPWTGGKGLAVNNFSVQY